MLAARDGFTDIRLLKTKPASEPKPSEIATADSDSTEHCFPHSGGTRGPRPHQM